MELVYQTRYKSEANKIVSLLERNGIPAFITNENSNNLRKWSMSQMGVFVHINEQRDEAINLINNPDYKVQNKVDMAHFVKMANRTNINDVNIFIIQSLLKSLVFLLILGAAIYAFLSA